MEELKLNGNVDFKSRAESNTPKIDKNKAEIDNGLLRDKYDSISAMADAFKTACENSLSGAVIQLNEGRGTISFPSAPAMIKVNEIKKPFSPMMETKQWSREAMEKYQNDRWEGLNNAMTGGK